jgi:hypothetical protein
MPVAGSRRRERVMPEDKPESTLNSGTTYIDWVAALKNGPLYIFREPPATPGDKGGVGPDVPKEYLGPRA